MYTLLFYPQHWLVYHIRLLASCFAICQKLNEQGSLLFFGTQNGTQDVAVENLPLQGGIEERKC